MRRRLRTAALLLAPLLTWELLSRLGPWPASLLPGPLAVAEGAGGLIRDGRLGAATGRSLVRLAEGYAAAAGAGVPLGIALARSRRLRRALRPLVLGMQALPSICWLPLAALWFGLSEVAVLFVVVMGSLLAVAIATEDGVAAVDPVLLRASGTLGIRGARFHLGVLLPAAFPGILTGLKLGWSFAWRSLMSAELIFAGGGLGQLLAQGREHGDAAQVVAVMAAIVAVGVAIDQVLFRTIELRVRRRWGLAEVA